MNKRVLMSAVCAWLCLACRDPKPSGGAGANAGTQAGVGGMNAGAGGSGGGGSGGEAAGAGGSGGAAGSLVGSGGSGGRGDGDSGTEDAGPSGPVEGSSPCLTTVAGEPGTLDPTFQTDGPDIAARSPYADVMAIDYQDRTVVAEGETLSGGIGAILMMRFDQNGAPDASFGREGAVTYQDSAYDDIALLSIAIDELDRIWLAGRVALEGEPGEAGEDRLFLARFIADGSLDADFAPAEPTPGFLIFVPREQPMASTSKPNTSALLRSEGGVFMTGFHEAWFLDHVLDDGAFDPGFTPRNDVLHTRALERMGDTLLLGSSSDIRALTTTGATQADFTFDAELAEQRRGAPHLLVLPDGRFLAIVEYTQGERIARFSAQGALDGTFGEAGLGPLLGQECLAQDIAVLCDGRIVTVGLQSLNDTPCARVFDSEGHLDPNVPAEGYYEWQAPGTGATDPVLRIDHQGRILVYTAAVALERFIPPWGE